MAENRYVKCEVCGRRVPGPPRKCDICDGRMTYKAEDSYYTPEGIIEKRHRYNTETQTPSTGRRSKSQRKQVVNSRNSKSQQNTSSEWENISNLTTSQGGSNSDGKGKEYDVSAFHDWANKVNKYPILKFIVGFIVLAILAAFSIADLGHDPYDDGYDEAWDYNSSTSVPIDKSSAAEKYIITAADVEYFYNDEEPYDEDDESIDDEPQLQLHFQLEYTGDGTMKISPFDQLGLIIDGQQYDLSEIEIDGVDEGMTFYGSDEFFTLESGRPYYGTIYIDADGRSIEDIKLIHNLGGDLDKRDTGTDIVMNLKDNT